MSARKVWFVTGAGRGMGVDVARTEPPLRWVAGAVAVQGVEQTAWDLLALVAAHRALSSSLAHDDAP